MQKTIKNLLVVIFYLCLVLCWTRNALAQTDNNFETSLVTTYSVGLKGVTRVEHAFRIKNLSPEYYISKYSLKLGSDDISDVKVISNNQIMDPNVNQEEGLTKIQINFPDKLVGKDKVRQFSITYLDTSMAQVSGQVLEAHIPAMHSEDNYSQHQVKLVTPSQFGEPARITPENYQLTQDEQNIIITYDQIQGRGVSAIFGFQQIFNLNLRYHLNNPNNQTAITQVSLPPDTPYQKVNYHQLQPRPQQIKIDEDGNWIATYQLPANETTEVKIEADVLVSLEPIHPWLNIEPLAAHTQAQSYWPVSHTDIQQLAKQHTQAKDIYQFTIDQLDYTQEDLSQNFERLGATNALAQPQQATCQEFSDVFITLARANNIATRRATGYAHSNDPQLQPLSLVKDVLHAWPEYYDRQQKQWIPIDPTWGDTMDGVDYFSQFDLKHVVFAYNGISSKYPLAAGDYKLPNQETKDVKVDFKSEFNQPKADFNISLAPKKILNLISIPSFYELTVENLTGQAWYRNQIDLQPVSPQPEIITNIAEEEFNILPWQKKTIAIRVFNRNHWLPKKDTLQLTLSGSDYTYEEQVTTSTISPIDIKFQNEEESSIGQIAIKPNQIKFGLAIFAGVFAIATGSLLVYRRKR